MYRMWRRKSWFYVKANAGDIMCVFEKNWDLFICIHNIQDFLFVKISSFKIRVARMIRFL